MGVVVVVFDTLSVAPSFASFLYPKVDFATIVSTTIVFTTISFISHVSLASVVLRRTLEAERAMIFLRFSIQQGPDWSHKSL